MTPVLSGHTGGAASGSYRRKPPHWQVDGAPLFITWRLYGSLPACVAFDPSVRSGEAFVQVDRKLDAARFGPVWLKDLRLAAVVVNSLHFGERELRLYDLVAWVVMSNHVHVVVYPHAAMWKITKAIKGFSARKANEILGRSGQPFWQHESFDRWIRDRRELDRIVAYVEANPVKGGLVGTPEEWFWSSAWDGRGEAHRNSV
jgi:REP element-mobilizing transposase RayT